MSMDVAHVPDGWRIARLGEVANIQKGSSFTSKKLVAGDVPVIAGGREPAYYHNNANRPPGAITVSASGAHAGFVSYHTMPILATDCTTVVTNSRLAQQRFIYQALKLHQEAIYLIRSGSAQPHVYPTDIASFRLMLPPLSEQQAIAEVLDSIDEAIERADEVISATEDLRDALLHELLTRGLPGQHTEWKEVPSFGTIPASWRAIRLGDIAEVIGGSTPSRKQPKFWGGDIPWVIPSEVTELIDRELRGSRESITTEGLSITISKSL